MLGILPKHKHWFPSGQGYFQSATLKNTAVNGFSTPAFLLHETAVPEIHSGNAQSGAGDQNFSVASFVLILPSQPPGVWSLLACKVWAEKAPLKLRGQSRRTASLTSFFLGPDSM